MTSGFYYKMPLYLSLINRKEICWKWWWEPRDASSTWWKLKAGNGRLHLVKLTQNIDLNARDTQMHVYMFGGSLINMWNNLSCGSALGSVGIVVGPLAFLCCGKDRSQSERRSALWWTETKPVTSLLFIVFCHICWEIGYSRPAQGNFQ